VNRLKTTSRKPSTNGNVERIHRTLNSLIAKAVNDYHSNWSDLLLYLIFSYNCSPHSATGLSPFEVLFGRKPRWHIDSLLYGGETQLKSVPEYTADIINKLRSAHHLVRKHLNTQAAYMSTWYDRRVKPITFRVGEKVRVFNDATKPGLCPKWLHYYKDVATVIKCLNNVTYLLACDNWRDNRVVHVDKLKRIETFDA